MAGPMFLGYRPTIEVGVYSDVVFGATVGTIAGRTVTRHGRSNFSLVPISTSGGKGFTLVYIW
jgi:hypothetical protein